MTDSFNQKNKLQKPLSQLKQKEKVNIKDGG